MKMDEKCEKSCAMLMKGIYVSQTGMIINQ